MVLAFKGRKSSSSSRKATRHDDSLFGTDTVEALLAVSEGPVKGWPKGASSFFVGDVPLLDEASASPNISNFELRLLKGTNPADTIQLNLGGQASTRNVGLELRTPGQTIVTQGTKTQIDYIDFRFVIQRLLTTTKEGGEFPTDLSFKIEVKRRSSSTWEVPFTNEIPPDEDLSGASSYRPGVTTPGSVVNGAYRETYINAGMPAAAEGVGAMWFDTTKPNWEPGIWNGTAWVTPTNLASGTRNGYPIWTWVDFDGAIRTAWYSGQGLVPPPGTLEAGDFLITPQSGEEIYSYNDTAWVGFQSWATPNVIAPGTININGLSRSSVPKEYRIAVKRINEPYDMRVTRITAATTKETYADITFESIQEVNQDPVQYPDLAIAWLTIRATDTFTSIPEFTSVMQGLVIPVPSNCTFNETTKLDEYVGLWDGSFKMAYTNSPAWHAYNFIMNARYGKNSYYPEVADKWDFYAFAKHCTLHGLRFNEYITEARPLNELINYIVGLAGGRYIDRGDGYSSVLWDADDQPAVAIFAPENTVEGAFTYSFTDVTERKNDFKVSFKNPELNYREDRLRVYDQNSIDIYGRNAEEFVAVGCRDHEEAVRRGRLRLATALTECIIVNFKTNRLGRYLTPFQVILIADDQSTNVISGRVLNADPLPAGTSVLPLRDQIYLEAGISYQVSFTLSDNNGGLKVVSYPLSVPSPGQQSVLRLSSSLAEAIPEYAVFSIGSPKAFRVTSITEADDDKDSLDITAIEVNRQKWAFVDGKVELRDILAVQTGPLSKYVYPVSGAMIIPEITLDGHYNLVVKWNPSETKLIRGYRLYQSLNNGPMNLLAEPSDTQFTIPDVTKGTYVVSIVAVGLDGTTESPPVTVQYIVSNATSLRSVAPPTNLRLVDEPEAPIFRAIDPRFTWDAAADPLVTRYQVDVVNGQNRVVHTERVEGQLGFTYSLIANRADNGGTPIRQFTVRVRSLDSTGNFSDPASLVVSHPAPVILPFTLDATTESVFVSYSQPTGDWAGTLIWMELVDGFDPLTTQPRYDGQNTFVSLPAKAETNYYVCAAAYDSYGKTGLNIGPQKRIYTSNKLFDPNGPNQPTGLALTTAPVILADGTITASITATWDAPLATDTAYGQPEVEFGEGTGANVSFLSDRVPAAQRSWTRNGFRPGITYSVRLRFRPNATALGLGPYTVVQTIQAALNTAAPANPTNITVSAAFEQTIIRYTPSVSKDVRWVEVWMVNSSQTAAAPTAGATIIGYVPGDESQFWDITSSGATRTYWLRAVNTSDVPATAYVRAGTGVSAALVGAQLAAGVIDATKFASTVAYTPLVDGVVGLAAPTDPRANYVTNKVDGKLYTWNATLGKWVPVVAGLGENGTLTAAQIAGVDAATVAGTLTPAVISKITGLTSTQIASLDAAVIAGTLPDAAVAKINTAKLGDIDAAKLTGSLSNALLTSIPAAKVAGFLPSDTVAKIDLGSLQGNLAANKVKIQASAIGLDQYDKLQGSQLANLDGALITTGTVPIDRVPTIPTTKLSGLVDAIQATEISTLKLKGTIDTTQITDNAITTAKIGANQVTAANIAALAVTTEKLAVTSANLAFNSGCALGGLGFYLGYNTSSAALSVGVGHTQWCPAGFRANWLNFSTVPTDAGSVADLVLGQPNAAGAVGDHPVLAGGRYEFSAYFSPHRCSGYVLVAWYNAAGAYISEVGGTVIPSRGYDGTTSLADWNANNRSFLIAVAPAGAAFARLAFRTTTFEPSNATVPYLFVSGIMFAPAYAATQTRPSPYTATGTTVVSGGSILTNTLDASKIVTDSITATQIGTDAITAVKIKADAVTAVKIAVDAVLARNIQAGAVQTSKLSVSSANRAFNPDFAQGILGVVLGGTNSNLVPVFGPAAATQVQFAPNGYKALAFYAPGTPSGAGQYADVTLRPAAPDGTINEYPVAAGARYEVSVALSTHRCTGQVFVQWLDANSAHIDFSAAGVVPASNYAARQDVAVFPRASAFATAPAGAVYGRIVVRFLTTTEANPYLFLSCVMFAAVPATQTEFSPYIDAGTTTINGAQILAKSIKAVHMEAESVKALLVQANRLDADNINAAAIKALAVETNRLTASNIEAAAIKALAIGANQLTAGNIAAGAVVASKLAIVSDNQMPNADLAQPMYGNGVPYLPGFQWGGSIPFDTPVIRTDFCPIGYRALSVRFPAGAAANGIFDFQAGVTAPDRSHSRLVPAFGGSYVEASAFLCALYGGLGQLYLQAFDSNKALIQTWFNDTTIPQGPGGGGAAQWEIDGRRARIMVQLPAGTAYVQLTPRWYQNGSAATTGEAYFFVSGLMLATITKAQFDARELSPFSAPGATTISGSAVSTGTLHANRIVANTITTNELAADAVYARNIYAKQITTEKLDSAAVVARTIAAGAVTASKLSIGSMAQNLVVNGDMEEVLENGTIAGWVLETSGGGANFYTEPSSIASSGSRVIILNKNGATSSGYIGVWSASSFPIEADATYELAGMVYLHNAASAGISLRLWIYDQNGGYLTFFDTDMSVTYPFGSTRISKQYRTPAGARLGRVELYNWQGSVSQFVSFDTVSVRRASGVTLIEDGAITTDKIAVNQVLAKNIAAEAITARHLLLVDTSNAVLNGDFGGSGAVGNFEGWTSVTGASISTEANLQDPGGKHRMVSNQRDQAWSNYIAGQPGDTIAVSSVVFQTANSTANLYVAAQDAGGTILSYILASGTDLKNQWVRLEGKALLPAGTQRYRVLLQNNRTAGDDSGRVSYWGKVQARRAAGATLIVDGSITASQINVDSIRAGILTAGVVKGDIIDGGAITADKIGVGLNTGNLLSNTDFRAGSVGEIPWGFTWGASNGSFANLTVKINDIGANWQPPAMRSLAVNATNTPDNDQFVDVYYPRYQSDGNNSVFHAITGGQWYELTGYVSAHRTRCYVVVSFQDASGNQVGEAGGSQVRDTYSSGALSAWARSTLKVFAPAGAATARVTLRMHSLGANNPYAFWTGIYFGRATPNQTVFSDWAPASQTVIVGGQLATNSITADKIVAGSITTDRLQAGQINADRLELTSLKTRVLAAGAVTADTITVGNGSLSSLISGTNSTTINGAAISANTISVNKIQIGQRGISVLGLNMRFNATSRRIEWDQASFAWIASDGGQRSVSVSGGSFQVSGSNVYEIFWYEGKGNLDWSQDDWGFTQRSPTNTVSIATYNNQYSGLAVNYGATVIDGDQIITGSIKANRIAANQIQTDHMAANSINGDRIVAGTLVADKIAAGTINVGDIMIGNDRFRIESRGRRIRIYGNNGTEAVCIGDVSPWTGNDSEADYGIIIRANNNAEVIRVSQRGAVIQGAYIAAATIGSAAIQDAAITNAKIGNLEVTNAKIQNLTIGNEKVGGNTVSTLVTSSGSGNSAGVSIRLRDASGGFLIAVSMRGNGVGDKLLTPGQSTGALRIYATGDTFSRQQVDALIVPVTSYYNGGNGGNRNYTPAFAFQIVWKPGQVINYYFEVVYEGDLPNTGVTISVSEISK